MAEKSTTEPASPLVSAGNRIRETAKWLVVSLAGIGGVLAAGLQFTNVGALAYPSPRLSVAISASILIAIGAALILTAAVITATTKAIPLSALDPKKPRLKDPTLLQGYEDLDTLRTDYLQALTDQQTTLKENHNSPTNTTRVKAVAAQAQVKYLDGIVRNVLDVSAYDRLTIRWRYSSALIALGALIAGTGIALLAWATSPPENEKPSALSSGIISSPTEQHLLLTPAGQETLTIQLGETCPLTEPLDIYVLARTTSGSDILILEEGCNPIRLNLTAEWGTLHNP